jgi:hypothetical protein
VYVDKTDVVEGMLGREYMFDIKEITASRWLGMNGDFLASVFILQKWVNIASSWSHLMRRKGPN